ncbi:MAG: DUF1552 domain-containing protein [Planctomycetales bacterium]|nr:DUF1552 domain-containing protein [Planctomycetales bacterium]
MNSNGLVLSRRQALRGLGVAVALPAFETFCSNSSLAAQSRAIGVTATGAPLRMAFMSIPNGVQQKHWFPDAGSSELKLNSTMLPLEKLREHFQVIGGLKHENATAGNDGAGDHARASATFLTGARARKTAGSDIFVGVSIDQLAAQAIRGQTRFASLELSCEPVRNSGSCDSGYACAYQYNLAWSSPTTPVTPDPNPGNVFERLFGAGNRDERAANFARRQNTQRSILDFVLEDAVRVRNALSNQDRRKMDEYLSSVREIESRIQESEKFGALPNPEVESPSRTPGSFSEHMNIMFDILALAFQTDSTRIATLLLAYDGSNRVFPEIGIAEGHHHLTHNQDKEDLAQKVAAIDQYYMQHYARFLERLSQIEDVDGNSVLHNSMIIYGGAIADGNRHSHDNLPVILAGHAGGRIQTGRYLQVEEQPMSNLFVSMLDHYGISVESFGDSDRRLAEI